MASAGWLSALNHSAWSSPMTITASGAASARTVASRWIAACVASCRARVTLGASSRPIHDDLSRASASKSATRARSRSAWPANPSWGVLNMGLCEVPMPRMISAMSVPREGWIRAAPAARCAR